MSVTFSESINFLDTSVDAFFICVGAFAGVIVNVCLVEVTQTAHGALEGEGTTVAIKTLVLRENVSLNHCAHGHVRTIFHTQFLKLALLVDLEGTSSHLLSRVELHVLVEGRGLGVAREAARVGGPRLHAFVSVVDHLSISWLINSIIVLHSSI